MATPSYLGTAQLVAKSDGLLGRLGSYFGSGSTPAYAGSGQPQARGGLLAVATPIYASAPVREPIAQPELVQEEVAAVCAAEEPQVVMCPIDAAALAAGQIAIVIPRQGDPIQKP